MTQRGATPNAAVDAAFRVVQRELHDVRAVRRARTSGGVAQETWQAPMPIATGKATRSVPQV